MSIEAATGVFALKSWLSGALAAFLVAVVSVLAIFVGFAIVPLAAGNETKDAARRLAAGLLSSFTLGPPLAIALIDWKPGILAHWLKILGPGNELWAYLATAVPIIAVTALAGFWIVAAFMAWFTRRAGKDLGQMAVDAANTVKEIRP